MNKDINIAEILKDAPEGTKLWSIIHGPVELVKSPIMRSLKGGIICKTEIPHNNIYVQFDQEGHWLYEVDGRICHLSRSIDFLQKIIEIGQHSKLLRNINILSHSRKS